MSTEINLTVPQRWNDLSDNQLQKILKCLHYNREVTDSIKLELLVYLFLDDKNDKKSIGEFQQILANIPLNTVDRDILYLSSYLEFILNDINLTKFPSELIIDGKTYYGPADRLSNLTIEELSFADHIYFNWITTGKQIELDRLVTVLYREKTKIHNINDIREDFSRHTLSQRGSILPTLDEEIKLAIGYAYKGSRDLMFSKFKIIFPTNKNTLKQGVRKPVKYRSFNAMIHTMSMGETMPLGNLHEVKRTNAYDFFTIVQETIIMQRERNKQLKN